MFNIQHSREFRVCMSTEMHNMLQNVSDSTGYKRSEVFRRSVGLYKLAREAQDRGAKVIIEEPDGNQKEITGI